jgi:two-component system, HptB-dependent secretion and biofilm response regulator
VDPNDPRASTVRDRKRRVLIVDDIEDNREMYALTFASAGYEVDVAREGEEALARARVAPPDIVVMDLAMPGLDGWETTRALKKAEKGVVIIVVTGHATDEGLERARREGADDVYVKPCLPHVLLAKAAALLAARQK